MKDESAEERDGIARVSRHMLDLIHARRYEEAREAIAAARRQLPERDQHRLTALMAGLEDRLGRTEESVELMRQAVLERPDWLPHLYELSIYLMDMGRLADADVALDQLILASELRRDPAFLDEARMRKIICLRALGRPEEATMHRAKLSAGAFAFIGNRRYDVADLD